MRISDWSSDVCSSDLATLAHGRVTGGFLGLELVDQYVVQAHAAAAVVALVPAHEAGRRAHAVAVGRRAGDIARQLAASFDHDAQAAEREHLDRDRRLLAQ